MSRVRNPVRGFTLIELLVVVAIIALLISILLPALSGARKQAKQTYCMANMDAIGKAMSLYASDNKDWIVQGDPVSLQDQQRYGTNVHFIASLLPGLGHPENLDRLFRRGNGTPGTDAEELHRVCKRTGSLQCPDFPEEKQSLDYVVNAFRIPHRFNNQQIASQPGPGPAGANPNTPRSVMFNRSKGGRANVAEIIYVTEAHALMPLPPEPDDPWPNNPNEPWGQLIDVFIPNHMPLGAVPRVANDQRHPRGITASFFDGHAEVNPVQHIDPGYPATINDRCRKFTYDENEVLTP